MVKTYGNIKSHNISDNQFILWGKNKGMQNIIPTADNASY